LDETSSERELAALRLTCRLRRITEQNSLLLTGREGGSDCGLGFLHPNPVTAIPAHVRPGGLGWGASTTPVLLPTRRCSAALLIPAAREGERGRSPGAVVWAQRRRELWTRPAERGPVQTPLCQRPLESRQYVRHMAGTCCAPAILG